MSMPFETAAAPSRLRRTQPFYWSVRRELWESRAIYLAPMIVAGILLFGMLIALGHSSGGSMHWTSGDQNQVIMSGRDGGDHAAIHRHLTVTPAFIAALPFEIMAAAVGVTGAVVGMFYCLGALFNERRDRSILFWKSMPVSNLVSVLAKAAVPMLVIPAVGFVVATVAQFATLLIALAGLTAHGQDPSILWSAAPFGEGSLVLIYGLIALALWYAPIYAWLLLVSAWSKNMTFLWAVAPPLVLAVFERVAFGTGHVGDLSGYRLTGVMRAAFQPSTGPRLNLANIDLAGFLATPGLWLGLIAAALMVAAVVWLRRRREPI